MRFSNLAFKFLRFNIFVFNGQESLQNKNHLENCKWVELPFLTSLKHKLVQKKCSYISCKLPCNKKQNLAVQTQWEYVINLISKIISPKENEGLFFKNSKKFKEHLKNYKISIIWGNQTIRSFKKWDRHMICET